MPKARVNGVETHYTETGSGTPLLFIHGGFGGAQSTLVPQMRPVHQILSQDPVRTISYDRRCAGQSEYVLSEYTLPDLAADARALLGHLGVERAIIVGDSMGGMVAQQYALRYPETVIALCLVETGPALMASTSWGKEMREQVEEARREGDRALFERRKAQLRNPPEGGLVAPRSPEMAERMRAMRQAYVEALRQLSDEDLFRYSTGMIRNQGAFLGYDFTPRLGELRMPMGIIHGNADTTVPFENAELLHRAIPGSELHIVDGAAHGVLMWPSAAEALRTWVLQIVG
jgi:pimeloyl-ACP methyl ester carboxylesterase